MPLTLNPALPSDIPTLIAIDSRAYNASRGTALLFPHGRTAAQLKVLDGPWLEALFQPGVHLVKVVDDDADTDEKPIIAFACWHIRLDGQAPLRPSQENSKQIIPEGADPAIHALKTLIVRPRRAMHIGQRPHVYLANLVTDPAHRGRGAGRMLVEWGTGIADANGTMSYVQASPEGKGLYERCGFEIVWGVEEEMRREGEGERWYRTWLMERRPKGTSRTEHIREFS